MQKILRHSLLLCAALLPPAGHATGMDSHSTALSDVFQLQRVTGGLGIWKWKRDDIYATDKDNGLKYIGTVAAGSPNVVQSFGAGGLEHRVLAISRDGRTILFDHQQRNAPSQSRLKAGLYRYQYGRERQRITSAKPINTAMWVQWPRPLPKNLLPFTYAPATYTPDDMTWAIRADDSQIFPLALLDAKPIHRCAFAGDLPACRRLLEQGANIDEKTYWGFTPVDLAIIRDHADTAILLLNHDTQTGGGIRQALSVGVVLGRMRIVTAALTRGADVNRQDRRGDTALHKAVYAGRRLSNRLRLFFAGTETPRSIMDKHITTTLVRLLLENGADPDIVNKRGKAPVDEAYKFTPAETVQLLLKYMKRTRHPDTDGNRDMEGHQPPDTTQ